MPSAANQNVYTGADGTILLAPAGDGPEGGAASAVIDHWCNGTWFEPVRGGGLRDESSRQ